MAGKERTLPEAAGEMSRHVPKWQWWTSLHLKGTLGACGPVPFVPVRLQSLRFWDTGAVHGWHSGPSGRRRAAGSTYQLGLESGGGVWKQLGVVWANKLHHVVLI